jgi:hypothetical protein
LEAIIRCGGIAFYATSVEEVKDKLKELVWISSSFSCIYKIIKS